MEYLVKFQLNIYALIILGILFATLIIKSRVNYVGKILFLITTALSALAIIIEPLTWIFDSADFYGAYFLEYATNFLLLLMGPIICGFMLSYVDYYIFKDIKRLQKRYFYLWPTIFTVVPLIINIFYPIYFSVDAATNIYSTEKFLFVQYIIVVGYYLFMILFTLKHRKKTYRYAMSIFFIFFSLPIIGMILQLFIMNLFFAWSSIPISLMVVYIFIESSTGEKDYLTKLYSRLSYERYVKHLIEAERQFSVLFIDLDNFKSINDEFGHFKGDQILVEFGHILEKAFSPNRMISRLGGDEFIIVLENQFDIEACIKKSNDLLKKSDDALLKKLKYSFGYQGYIDGMNIDQLYIKVDKKMYLNKNKK